LITSLAGSMNSKYNWEDFLLMTFIWTGILLAITVGISILTGLALLIIGAYS